MLDLRRWSFASVALASVLWVVVNVALIAAAIYIRFRWETRGAGSGGIGAVSYGFGLVLPVLYLFGPPALLTAIWYVQRRS